jgi:uncharacterized protein YjbI with pentapeptide repeats
MDPTVVAAWIAAGVSVLTLAGTVITQVIGFRSTKADTEDQIKAQSDQLDKTLAEQRQQLERTLAEQRTRMLNERFARGAEQLGSDKPAVRLAGVYAMAGLADDWEESRQACVDVLCAYLRMPYEPDPGQDAPEPQRLAFQAAREVRHTVIRVITAHLKKDAATSWQGLHFDLTGVVFDGGDFRDAEFSRGTISFSDARFSDGTVSFRRAEFSGAGLNFRGARFTGGMVDFSHARFSGGNVDFRGAQFSGGMIIFEARFSGGTVYFYDAQFSGSMINFRFAQFSGAGVDFISGRFSGGTIDFSHAIFSGGTVLFKRAGFSGGMLDFTKAEFSGGMVDFDGAEFSGGEVDFVNARDWSVPPAFPWTGTPPPGVKLPRKDSRT